MNLEKQAETNHPYLRGKADTADALHYKRILEEMEAKSNHHAAVVMSLRMGRGLLPSGRPSIKRLKQDTLLPERRVREILEELRGMREEL